MHRIKQKSKRYLSILLILAMALTLIPLSATPLYTESAIAGAYPSERLMQSETEFVVVLDPEFADRVLSDQAELFMIEETEAGLATEVAEVNEVTGIDEETVLAEADEVREILEASETAEADAGDETNLGETNKTDKKNLKKLPPGLLKKESGGKRAHIQNLERSKEKRIADEPVIITVEVEDKSKMQEARAAVEMCEGVLYTDPLVYYYADAFDDARTAEQWGLLPIDAYDAWNGNTNLSSVVIAIVDTGVRSTHEDLAANLVAGYNFIEDNTETTDKHGHGTHVAGIAAAISNNGKGIASPAGGAKIMPVRVLGADGLGSSVQVAGGIRYAVDNGAQIINLSLGSSTYSRVIDEAVKYALDNGRLVVAASGNDYSKDTICYPAAQTGVIIVSALSSSSQYIVVESGFANYSSAYADRMIHAPGDVILSTDYSGDSVYSYKSGTSMATAYVSGMAAALLAKGGYAGTLYNKLLNETVSVPRYYKNGSSILPDQSGASIKVLNDNGNMDAYNNQEFTVTFSGSGSPIPGPQTIKLGDKVTKPGTDPTLTGYDFLGWKKSGEEELYDFARPVDSDFTINSTWEIIGGGGGVATQALIGAVSVIGNARFGQTLGVDTTGLTTDSGLAPGTFIYQWNREGVGIVGALAATYAPVQADVGKSLTVTVAADNSTGSITSESTAPIAKAEGPAAPARPTAAGVTPTGITLNAISGAEYMRVTYDEFGPGGVWQDSVVFGGLSPNTGYAFCARIKETATREESPISAFSLSIKTSMETVATPTASPDGGSFSTSQDVTLSCATAGATVYYTLDGSAPTVGSSKYNGVFTLTESTTVKAIAVKADMADSAVMTVAFTKSGGGVGGGGGGGGGGGPTSAPTIPVNNGAASVGYTQSGGTVLLSIPESKINEIINAAKSTQVVFDLSRLNDATGATLSKAALTGFAGAGLETQVKFPLGSIAFDVAAVKDVTAKTGGAGITASMNEVSQASLTSTQRAAIKPGDLVFNIKAMSGSQVISDFNGTATITAPYDGEGPVKVWYLSNAGQLEEMVSTYSSGSKSVKFTTNHFSLFVVGEAVTQPIAPEKPVAPEKPEAPVKPVAPEIPTSLFADVTGSNWFIDDVAYVYYAGLMNGTSTNPMLFSPNQPLTRGMIVTILHRQAGAPSVNNSAAFADAQGDEYYTAAVAWAAAKGIVAGYGDGNFGPNDNVTREQLATIIFRYQQFSGNIPAPAVAIINFNDLNQVSEYAREAVTLLTTQGIISGKPGNMFDPKGNATRAEVAAILYRYLNQ